MKDQIRMVLCEVFEIFLFTAVYGIKINGLNIDVVFEQESRKR